MGAVDLSYEEFLRRKASVALATGIIDLPELNQHMFEFQKPICRFGLRRGRAAFFGAMGLGKTLLQQEWARVVAEHTRRPVIILAPLAVAAQSVREGEKFGISVNLCRDGSDVRPGINITNYERLHKFDPATFGGVVLDESSCIRSYDGKLRTTIIESFAGTSFRLSCTATPAPNDYEELGNQCEFLGVMKRVEMLSMFFTHDSGDTGTWRLKGHARTAYWRWVATWAAVFRKPSDLGFSDEGYDLPALHVHEHVLPAEQADAFASGRLFVDDARGLSEQRRAKRASLSRRVAKAAELVASEPNESWLVLCELNDEGNALAKAITGSVQVAGSDSIDEKEERLLAFADGKFKVLITKSAIAGWGMNWQHAARILFVGVTNSYEQFTQSIGRLHRFGQKREVHCHVILGEAEGAILSNLKRKHESAVEMTTEMSRYVSEVVLAEEHTASFRQLAPYRASVPVASPSWARGAR